MNESINYAENDKKVAKYAIAALIVACLMDFILIGIVYNTLSMYMAPILEAFPNISRTGYALSLTVMSFFSAGTQLLVGPVAGKIGLKKTAVMGLCLAAIALVLYSVAKSIFVIFVAALLFGGAVSFCNRTITCPLIANWFARKVSFLQGIVMLMSGIAATIFSTVVGTWIDSLGYRKSLLIEVAIMAGLILVVLVFMKVTPESMGLRKLWEGQTDVSEQNKKKRGSADRVMPVDVPFAEGRKSAVCWLIMLIGFINAICIYAVMQTIPTIAQLDLGLTATVAGTVLSVMYILNSFAPPVIGLLNDTIGMKIVIPACMGIYVIGLLVMLLAPAGVGTLYVVAICTGIALSMINLFLPTTARFCFGNKDFVKYEGLFLSGLSFGIAFSALTINAIFDATGSYAPALWLYAAAMIVSIALFIITIRKATKYADKKRAEMKLASQGSAEEA